MEKQGMDRGERFFRTGLLISLLILLSGGFLFPQADGGTVSGESTGSAAAGAETPKDTTPPRLNVRIETSPVNPVVNNPWSVFLWVNHPWPQEVNVKPPQFPSSLILERVRTETRTVSGDRWTRVEFLFTPQAAGAVAIDPFEVTIPGQRSVTGALNIRFRDQPRVVSRYKPRFGWVNPAPSVPSGKPVVLVLELAGWDPAKNPPEGIFRGKTPRSAIVDEGKPAAAGNGIYRYSISITALEEDAITLGPLSFQAEGFSLTVPEITVPVLPSPSPGSPGTVSGGEKSGAAPSAEELPPEFIPPDFALPLPFPSPLDPEKVFPLFRTDYSRIVAGVRALWDKGNRAEALAEIRRNERDSLSGPFLVSLRKEMEQLLDLGFTDNERWRPLKIPLFVWVILGFLILFAIVFLLVFRPRQRILRDKFQWKKFRRGKVPEESVTSRGRGGFRTVIILILAVGLIVIFLKEGLGNFMVNRMSPSGEPAVLEKTRAFRVPDEKGAVNTWFGEGQPVIVGEYRGQWCFAESTDGRSGWVRREAVVTY